MILMLSTSLVLVAAKLLHILFPKLLLYNVDTYVYVPCLSISLLVFSAGKGWTQDEVVLFIYLLQARSPPVLDAEQILKFHFRFLPRYSQVRE